MRPDPTELQVPRVSREGYEFRISDVSWKLSRDVSVSTSWTGSCLGSELQQGFVRALAHYAVNFAPGTVASLNSGFKKFIRFLPETRRPISAVRAVDLISYRAHLGKAREGDLGHLAAYLKTWCDLQFAGMEDGVFLLLDGWRLKGQPKGVAVQTMCPLTGPLTEIEHRAVCQQLVDSFGLGEIGLEDFVLTDLFIASGRRPVQLGDLKLKDVLTRESDDQGLELVLNIPRRKQGRSWRSEFKPLFLLSEKGVGVMKLVQQNRLRLRKRWPDLSPAAIEELPLFPSWRKLSCMARSDESQIELQMRSEAFHLATQTLSERLERVVARLNVRSERTGEMLRVFPLRLRRNVATRAARQGFGSIVIAELLDHSDDQNARVYTENVPEHVDAINAAVARQLAPLAQAFCGMLVDHESDALRGADISSRIRTDSGEAVGSCGQFGFCGAHAPIACYTCRAFQPWLDAPHEALLESLIEERAHVAQVTRDDSMAAIKIGRAHV